MDERKYLNTNVDNYYFAGFALFAQVLEDVFTRIDKGLVYAHVSELVLAELLVQPLRRANAEEEWRCREILRPRSGLSVRHPITLEVLEETARLRAYNPSLRTPDAIHLATAFLNECDAMLTNDKRLIVQGLITIIPLSSLASRSPLPEPDSSPPEP